MGVSRRVRSLEGGLMTVCQRSWSTKKFQTLRTIVPDLRGVWTKEAKTVWRETRGGYHVNTGSTLGSTAETYKNCTKQIQSLWVIIICSLSRHFLDHGKSPTMLDAGLLEPASTTHLL
jgi:hypothetical protein